MYDYSTLKSCYFQGKTSLFLRSLESATKYYSPPPSKIYFLYKIFQPQYLSVKESLSRQGIDVEFSQATDFGEEELKEIASAEKGEIMVCIDDATVSTGKSKRLSHAFTVARHFKVSLVLFWHSLFAGTPEGRLISLNTKYFFLLSSPRLSHQVSTLASQIGMRKTLVAAYNEICNAPYAYILLDLSVTTPGFLRVRSSVFGEKGEIQMVYVSGL